VSTPRPAGDIAWRRRPAVPGRTVARLPGRFDEEHAFGFAKGELGLTAARVRTREQADRWVRLVMAAGAQLLLARPLAADLRRPWGKGPTPPGPCPWDGSAAGFRTSGTAWAPPPIAKWERRKAQTQRDMLHHSGRYNHLTISASTAAAFRTVSWAKVPA
jgi:hypothetical protein